MPAGFPHAALHQLGHLIGAEHNERAHLDTAPEFRSTLASMFRILLVTVAAASLLACSGSSAELVAPATWQVDCPHSQGDCFRQAHKLCPHGYEPIGSDNRTVQGEVIVRCNRPPEQ